jgi:DNA-binding MarR family transcriptional regulator
MSAARDLTIKQYRLLAELRYQIRRFLAYRDQTARDNGLEPQQYQALLTIKGAPPGVEVTIGRLAQRMLVRHHSAVEMIDRLAVRGLVTRTRHPEDRRKMLVDLTAKGERVLRELALSSREELRNSGPALVAVLRRLLNGD